VAEVVGRKLRELSKHHQVICVTHLPQIACFAESHYHVKKEVSRAGPSPLWIDWRREISWRRLQESGRGEGHGEDPGPCQEISRAPGNH